MIKISSGFVIPDKNGTMYYYIYVSFPKETGDLLLTKRKGFGLLADNTILSFKNLLTQ